MAEVINLNRVRKARAKVDREADAAANRAKFGRTGAEKRRDRDEARRATEALEAHRRDDPSPEDVSPSAETVARSSPTPAQPTRTLPQPTGD